MGSTAADGANGTNGDYEYPLFPEIGYTPIIKVDGQWEVEKVLEKVEIKPKDTPESPLAFFHMLERLKTTKREGWRRFGIERGESIADHMYRMSLITMFAPEALRPRLDLYKCMRMALIHDMAELLVGDITPVDGVAKPEKSRREATTMDYLTKTLLSGPNKTTADELRAIWQEYEDSETLDSTFVHDVDKVELLLQMVEYEKAGKRKLDLGEFAGIPRKIVLPEMKAWAHELVKEREAFWGDVVHGTDEEVSEDMVQQQDQYYGKDR